MVIKNWTRQTLFMFELQIYETAFLILAQFLTLGLFLLLLPSPFSIFMFPIFYFHSLKQFHCFNRVLFI